MFPSVREISMSKIQAHRSYSQKTFSQFSWNAELCLIFMNMSVKTRVIKVNSIENEETIMAMTMTKTVIMNIIILITMRLRIKIGNHIQI